jgi:hypothetical protein
VSSPPRQRREPFAEYAALGDSMSIDLFPALDVGATDVAVALERDPTVGAVAPIGAASLLYRNDDERWPGAAGQDLITRIPGVAFRQLASHGATIGDVFGDQIVALGESSSPTLVTLTIGTEDLFSAFFTAPRRSVLERFVADMSEAYELLVGAIRRMRPRSLIVLTTVCDPSDRIGRIPGIMDHLDRLPLRALDQFNDGIRALARAADATLVADAYIGFRGHGASVNEDRWYWERAPIEPNARGAHELRRIWWTVLDEAGALEAQ